MKFLQVYCENRKEEVYISIDKIMLIQRNGEEESCLITLDGKDTPPVKVAMSGEDLIRKINGEERIGIGFRRTV